MEQREQIVPMFVLVPGVVDIPGVVGGVVSQAPIRRPPGVRAADMTLCPRTELLSQMIADQLRVRGGRRGYCWYPAGQRGARPFLFR